LASLIEAKPRPFADGFDRVHSLADFRAGAAPDRVREGLAVFALEVEAAPALALLVPVRPRGADRLVLALGLDPPADLRLLEFFDDFCVLVSPFSRRSLFTVRAATSSARPP